MKFYYLVKNLILSLLNKQTIGVRILLIKDNQILLIKHTYMPGWYTIGGGIDKGESPLQAIHRELLEEVGVTLRKEPTLFGAYLNTYHNRDDYVICYIASDFEQNSVSSPEVAEQKWFDMNQLPEDTTPATRRRIAEYLGQKEMSHSW